ncbi:putative retrotransposon hot spot (RHS) protein [Trypanosoma cruzi]|nr:putative retrotransposon hot spot (RHS) protein [Trypanosoma cruzi]
MPLPSCALRLDAHSGTEEEERSFRAFDATSRATRVWNEGVSGVVADLRGAYNHWHQAGGQAEPPFGGLALWTRARRQRSTIPPTVSWILAGPYCRRSGRGS